MRCLLISPLCFICFFMPIKDCIELIEGSELTWHLWLVQVCRGLIKNGERQDEESFGGRRRTEALRHLCKMNPSQALRVRGMVVSFVWAWCSPRGGGIEIIHHGYTWTEPPLWKSKSLPEHKNFYNLLTLLHPASLLLSPALSFSYIISLSCWQTLPAQNSLLRLVLILCLKTSNRLCGRVEIWTWVSLFLVKCSNY